MSSVVSVSVLIPCFNAERWIGPAIQSALDQTHSNIEVIVVDDGSNDGSRTVIHSFADRVRFKFNPNLGGNATRNQLSALATGEWLQFLDADDYLTPQKIERQLSSASVQSNAKVDVIYSPVTSEVWRHDKIYNQSTDSIDEASSIEEQWIRWQLAQTGTVLWRREALLSIGGWNEDYPCCQDNEVTLRAIQNGLKFHYCPDAGAVYRIWSEDTVCRKDPGRVVKYKTQLIEQMMEWLVSQNKLTKAVEAAAGQAFFEMARTLAKYDLATAEKYKTERISAGWYLPSGAAAPWHYRLAHSIGGFSFAEKLAAWRRG